MGTEYISYKNKNVGNRDWRIWNLHYFFMEAIHELQNKDGQPYWNDFMEYFLEWDFICTGVIHGTDLDGILNGNIELENRFLLILERAKSNIENLGEVIPEHHFSKAPKHPNGYDYIGGEVKPHLDILNQLIEMIEQKKINI